MILDFLKFSDRINCNISVKPGQVEYVLKAEREIQIDKPIKNCQVHFSGVLIGGRKLNNQCSIIYQPDEYSELVGKGKYSDNSNAFPKAVISSFDGIAIDKGTHLVLYSQKDFKGEILLDIIGPAIISNCKWKNDSTFHKLHTEVYTDELQENYPFTCRQWSSSDMHSWSNGSCIITCEEC
jgi:hypothetical protein